MCHIEKVLLKSKCFNNKLLFCKYCEKNTLENVVLHKLITFERPKTVQTSELHLSITQLSTYNAKFSKFIQINQWKNSGVIKNERGDSNLIN